MGKKYSSICINHPDREALGNDTKTGVGYCAECLAYEMRTRKAEPKRNYAQISSAILILMLLLLLLFDRELFFKLFSFR